MGWVEDGRGRRGVGGGVVVDNGREEEEGKVGYQDTPYHVPEIRYIIIKQVGVKLVDMILSRQR